MQFISIDQLFRLQVKPSSDPCIKIYREF